MRIDWLKINSPWKNLNGFKIDFDETKDVAVLIGRNGAAKSNILEAILWIFSRIDLRKPALFSYEICYEFDGKLVSISAIAGHQPKAKVDGKNTNLNNIRTVYSPRHVVGYYSGVSDRFNKIFVDHDLLARNQTLVAHRSSDEPATLDFRKYICARPVHGLFALLSFYFSNDERVQRFLRDFTRITNFDSALLVVRKPQWARRGADAETFWGAMGPVRDFLERYKRHCLAPFYRSATVKTDFARRETRELLYLYLPDIDALKSLGEEYGANPQALFQALDTMRLSELIEDFQVRVGVEGSDGAIHTGQLSEGEQQLLTVLGLMRFTRDTGSLYFLDEPDTHLNPAWTVQYLELLRAIGGIEKNSHTFIATHDPLLVSGLLKEELRVLHRSKEGKIYASVPEEHPRGTGVAGVLTSELYGLESQLDPFSMRVLKRIYEVSEAESSKRRQRHLTRLGKLLPAIETSETSPDPYRNIARDAYELAQDITLDADTPTDKKLAIIEKLAQQLFENAKEASE
jgi:predicted ATPase